MGRGPVQSDDVDDADVDAVALVDSDDVDPESDDELDESPDDADESPPEVVDFRPLESFT